MSKCKTCRFYVANRDESKSGSCLQFGEKVLIEKHEGVFDSAEEDGSIYSIEVGENFGCIHHKD